MNISHEKFLSKFLKKLNTIDTVKELCAETVQGVLKFTKAQAAWIYLSNQELNSISVKKIYYAPDINKKLMLKRMLKQFLHWEKIYFPTIMRWKIRSIILKIFQKRGQ